MTVCNVPRPEYPRPDFERSMWLNLNGVWSFEFDDEDIGKKEGWYKDQKKKFSREIIVPFCYQSEMSGIHDNNLHEIMWYKRRFMVPDEFKDKRVLLHFGAVDYASSVWVNGEMVCTRQGGYVPFNVDITRFLIKGENDLTLRVEDRFDCMQPRGKQYWKREPDRCWYTPTSGIWQTVWLEAVGHVYMDHIKFTPDIDNGNVQVELVLDGYPFDMEVDMEVSFKGRPVNHLKHLIKSRVTKFTVDIREEDRIDERHFWTPENPCLYDVRLCLYNGTHLLDEVKSYFGMRKIAVQGDLILLNNRVYCQKLILDQGYWAESLLTPPSDEAIKADVMFTKQLGFNGARKHQKIEDPRYYYWADKLGLLVWGEMPSAYEFNTEEVENIITEMIHFINRDYNHPCIVTWVPFNESWGIRNIYANKKQKDFAVALYYVIKSLDQTRLVSTNDGWEQVHSDICAIHDYMASGEKFLLKYADKGILGRSAVGRMIYAESCKYAGQPVLITEYGGIALDTGNDGWGYGGKVKNEEDFIKRYESITNAIKNTPYIQGYCYTQLTDVFQEINGLMTMDRQFKVDPEKIRRINNN